MKELRKINSHWYKYQLLGGFYHECDTVEENLCTEEEIRNQIPKHL